jgi:hypothetical protein
MRPSAPILLGSALYRLAQNGQTMSMANHRQPRGGVLHHDVSADMVNGG